MVPDSSRRRLLARKKMVTNMKKIIILILSLLPFAAGATIDPDGAFTLVSGTKNTFDGACTVEVYPTYIVDLDQVAMDVRVYYSGTQVGGTTLYFAASHVAGYTATGSGEVEQFQNACEQAVDDYLENLSENSGVNFTIT